MTESATIRVERLVSALLRTGVVLSLLLLLAGTLLVLVRQADSQVSQQVLQRLTTAGEASQDQGGTWDSLLAGRGRALTVAGLLLLIFTPVARVIACTLAFAVQRDWRFVTMTAAVLILLLGSFLLGRIR